MTHDPAVRPAVRSLLGAGEIRTLAAELDLRPTKSLGQNFVHDANTVRRIVSAAQLHAGEHVLEVGPGLGSLTLGLLEVAGHVTAVEIDPRLAGRLPGTVAAHVDPGAAIEAMLTVVRGDALAVGRADIAWVANRSSCPTEPEWPQAAVDPTALVANLPYNVSVPVLLHLLAELPSLRRVLVMVQAEVADRLAAPPGSRTYGAPSAKAAWYGTVRRAGAVPRTIFWPVPGVDSALIRIDRHPGGSVISTAGRSAVFTVIDAAFAQRRKTLRAALAGWAGSAAKAGEVLSAAGIDPVTRGEMLDIHGFRSIAEVAGPAGAEGNPAEAGRNSEDGGSAHVMSVGR